MDRLGGCSVNRVSKCSAQALLGIPTTHVASVIRLTLRGIACLARNRLFVLAPYGFGGSLCDVVDGFHGRWILVEALGSVLVREREGLCCCLGLGRVISRVSGWKSD